MVRWLGSENHSKDTISHFPLHGLCATTAPIHKVTVSINARIPPLSSSLPCSLQCSSAFSLHVCVNEELNTCVYRWWKRNVEVAWASISALTSFSWIPSSGSVLASSSGSVLASSSGSVFVSSSSWISFSSEPLPAMLGADGAICWDWRRTGVMVSLT
jgi:hypothetical protein